MRCVRNAICHLFFSVCQDAGRGPDHLVKQAANEPERVQLVVMFAKAGMPPSQQANQEPTAQLAADRPCPSPRGPGMTANGLACLPQMSLVHADSRRGALMRLSINGTERLDDLALLFRPIQGAPLWPQGQ